MSDYRIPIGFRLISRIGDEIEEEFSEVEATAASVMMWIIHDILRRYGLR